MKNEPIVKIENISKSYIISHRASYDTLRDKLTEIAKKPFQVLSKKRQKDTKEKFWALKDINFNINRGERIGIIGKNGAGKSTLLKILSQITQPDTGKIELNGRVASLLEVGTGFHPELTGRENIFLNGAILGMKRSEIIKKFDEIVEFSEIGNFLDTPVKRYSSGMFVRLAFSVAAHLEPEILIVDEVLAVGDVQFQKKCLGKMESVANEGRTIIFVSHNMAAISQLCERTVLLEHGQIVVDDKTVNVINRYLSSDLAENSQVDLANSNLRKNSLVNSKVKWKSISIKNSKNVFTENIGFKEPFVVELVFNATQPANDVVLGISLQSNLGVAICNSFQNDFNMPTNYTVGQHKFRVLFKQNMLAPGVYEIGLGANGPGISDWFPMATQFRVSEVNEDKNEIWHTNRGGILDLPVNWEKII